jgi:hypothetical protein
MSFKQCPGCRAQVAESKAYCPDCGAPMDEEQKREGSSEFDSQMKTQNLKTSDQFRLLEQLNNSTFFNLQPKGAQESKPVETDAKPVQSEPVAETDAKHIQSNPVENQAEPIQSKTIRNETKPVQSDVIENQPRPVRFNSVDNLTKTIYLTAQAEAKVYPKQPDYIAVESQNEPVAAPENYQASTAAAGSNAPKSKRTFYIVGGIIVFLFFILAVVFVIILGILYWNYWK